jgi:putative salt-induced outer membrane protein YdiY
MNRILITTLQLFLGVQLIAQSGSAPVTEDIYKVTILNPGVSIERSISVRQTVAAQAFFATTAQWGWSSSMGTTSSIYFDPAVSADYRYYYNLARRAGKELNTHRNNGNYLALTTSLLFSKMRINSSYYEEYKRRPVITPGLLWGVQRNYNSRISLDIRLGVGYRFARSTGYDFYGSSNSLTGGNIQLLAEVDLGIWLNKRNG